MLAAVAWELGRLVGRSLMSPKCRAAQHSALPERFQTIVLDRERRIEAPIGVAFPLVSSIGSGFRIREQNIV